MNFEGEDSRKVKDGYQPGRKHFRNDCIFKLSTGESESPWGTDRPSSAGGDEYQEDGRHGQQAGADKALGSPRAGNGEPERFDHKSPKLKRWMELSTGSGHHAPYAQLPVTNTSKQVDPTHPHWQDLSTGENHRAPYAQQRPSPSPVKDALNATLHARQSKEQAFEPDRRIHAPFAYHDNQ